MDLHGRLAVPSQACFVGKVALENRSGIGVESLGSSVLFEKEVELAQLGGDEVVVIPIPGIGGDAVVGGWVRTGVIIEGHHHHRLAARQDDARVGAALGVALQPSHIAMLAVLDPILKSVGMAGPLGRRHPQIGKAEFQGFGGEFGLEFGGVDGGSLAIAFPMSTVGRGRGSWHLCFFR